MTKKSSVPAVIGDIGEKIGGARKDSAVKVGPRPKLSDPADTRPGWAKRFVPAESIGYDKKPTGKWQLLDTRRESKWGGYRAASRMEFESQVAAEKAIPLIAVSQKHYVRENYAKGADGKYDASKTTYEIWRKVSDKKTVKAVAESFSSREAALAHMASQAETLLGSAKGYGEEILAKPERVVRKGPDWRKGDVHPEAFVKEIGARGVEFGNWQGERQTIVNHAYDAMRDLADITGVKPESLTLGNKLAIAFGARGNGGKRSARAHYEPKRAAINLTKESGAGTLAHEWWHAADHFLAQVDEPALGEMMIDKDGTKVLPHASDDYRIFGSHRVAGGIKPGNLSEPVKRAYKDLMDTMFNKPMEVTVDKPVYDAKLARAKESLKSELDRLRGEIAKPAPYGKRNVAAATPAQLAKFDKVAERILASTPADLETKYTYNNTDIALGSRGSMAGRWSNATLDELSSVYKEVRGRSGFDSQHGRGVMDTVRHRMSEVKTAMTLAEDAAKSATRTIMGKTDFAKNAVKLDQSRTTPYWQTRHEMAARAFTAFIEDKLAAAGRKSDYLSYGSDNALYKVFDEALPFPEGAERQAINAKFEALFEAMKQAEVVKASAPSPANMLSAMAKGSAEGQQTIVTGQNGKPNPGWSDAARAKSAEVRAADPTANLPKTGSHDIKVQGVTTEYRADATGDPYKFKSRTFQNVGWGDDGFPKSEVIHANTLEAYEAKVVAAQKAMRDGEAAAENIRAAAQKQKSAAVTKPAVKPRAAVTGDNGAPPDTQLKAAKRLEEVAKRTIERATEVANQPRLMNTARRARLGGGVIDQANQDIADAKTALKIAEALRNGEAGPLANVKSLADIRELRRLAREAENATDRAMKRSYKPGGYGLQVDDLKHLGPAKGYVRLEARELDDFKRALTGKKGFAADIKTLERWVNMNSAGGRSNFETTNPEVFTAMARVAKAVKENENTSWAKYKHEVSSIKYRANRFLDEIRDFNRVTSIAGADAESRRTVLKAFLDVREGRAKIDPVVAAERALIGTKIPGFFPTPQSLAARMADLAEIKPGMTVLEPSAGTGRLADAAKQRGAKVEAVEAASSLRDILTKKGHNIIGSDFNEVPIAQRYDRIMMNPPFEKGQDIAHVRRAYDMLKPGGKMVAIMGEGGFFRSDKQAAGFREWLNEVGGQAEKLPEGTFKESNTGVNTRLVTITKPGVNPGWSDAARLASAEVRAAAAETPTRVLSDSQKPMSAAMQRALETSQAKATETPSTLVKPAAVAPAPAAAPVSRQEFMAQAEVRAHPEGGHEVRGPGTNGQWVRTAATGSPTAAKLVAFTNHVGKAANKLGAIAMIAAPVTAAALAYDATRSQAAADGLSPTQQTTQALGSAAAAGLTTAGVGYGIMKGIGLLAKASPKIIGRALPGVGLGLMAYGAYQGAMRHGWKGAVLGTVGADGLLDLGADQVPQIRAALPAPTSMPDAVQKFEVANDAFNAMQESAASERILRGFQNPNNLAAALAAQGKELGSPAHGKP